MERAIFYILKKAVEIIEGNKYPILLLMNAFVSMGGTLFILQSSFRERLMDMPNKRSSHTAPVPRGGGIGILLAFMLSAMVLRLPTAIIYAAIIVGFVSFYADHFFLSIKFRLFMHFLAAFLFLFPYVNKIIADLFLQQKIPMTLFILFILLLIFIVGTANFFNFMDGINGIAGITGAIGFGLLAFNAYVIDLSLIKSHLSFVLLALCITISCIGFLPFNLPRARVFLGDVGSITLGFLFAGLVVYLSKSPLDFICFSGFLFPFYADELISVFVRLRKRQNLLIPHREHLYQLLANEMQISHWKISMGYGIAQLSLGLVILLIKPLGYFPMIFILLVSFIGTTILYCYIKKKVSMKQEIEKVRENHSKTIA
jgi:Fuc2NAc and GlcNAc transferase